MLESGVTSVSFRKNSVEEIIAATAAAGLDGIEWGGDVHVPAGEAGLAREVRRRTEAAGLKALSYGGYYRLGSSSEKEFDGLLACAGALGVRDVRIWGGSKGSADLSPGEWAALVAEAKALAQKAAAQGIVLSLECHNWTVTDDWRAAKRFLDEVGSPALRMYWQPNQFRTEQYNLEAARGLAPYVTNIHAFSWEGDKRLPLEAHGDRWKKYLAVLADGRPHALILEFMHDDRIETLPEAARVLRGWIRDARAAEPGGRQDS